MPPKFSNNRVWGKEIDFYMMKKNVDIGCCINMVVEVLDSKMVFSDPWIF